MDLDDQINLLYQRPSDAQNKNNIFCQWMIAGRFRDSAKICFESEFQNHRYSTNLDCTYVEICFQSKSAFLLTQEARMYVKLRNGSSST